MKRAALVFCCGAALMEACGNSNYKYAAVTDQQGDPAAVLHFNAGGTITLPEGSVAAAQITLTSQSGDALNGSIQSTDPSVLGVLQTATKSPAMYVFLGVHSGSASVQVVVDGQTVQTVSARVSAPPSSSIPPTIDAGVPADGGHGPHVVSDGGVRDGGNRHDAVQPVAG
jgi:hypothetical protein